MKIVLIDCETGEILEKGVLSKEQTQNIWLSTYAKINAHLQKEGIKKVWLLAPTDEVPLFNDMLK